MENDTSSDGDEQSTPDDTGFVEEREDDIAGRLDIQDDLEELSKQIDKTREEMIHPTAAQMVPEHTGISDAQAADLVETMQEVDCRTRDDDAG
jgi:hypothetical protein